MGEARGRAGAAASGGGVPVEGGVKAGGTLGLPGAVALVVGNIVGTGIFLLPASLAAIGSVSVLVLLLVTVGAIALAVVFGWLGNRIPAGGGPYAYARGAFGEFAGFWVAWSFWLTAWIGNAGIAYAWVGYVNSLFGWRADNALQNIVIGLVGLWIPAVINLSGVKNIGLFQIVTTVLKFAPLLFVGIVGVFFVKAANFPAWNATGGSQLAAISLAAGLILFAYSGMESVTIVAERLRDPARMIGKASVYGVLACAAMYLLATVAIFGTVPSGQLTQSTAPFADAINNMFGGSVWGKVMAACAVVSGIGALNGWTMLVAEMPMAAARDRMFPRPFAKLSRRGAPVFGILLGTVLTSLMLAYAYLGSENGFDTILLLASFTSALPYFFSAAAQLFWLVTGGREIDRTRLARDLVITGLAVLFGGWIVYGAGADAALYGVLMMLVGVPVYIWVKARRGEYGPGQVDRRHATPVS
ncbi:amino acid permease [Actinocorallia sp. API 0066]|uniref:amino acid permease n=1 Tax=Actinocorallia sp. API 0066 TaxID=2896846 RepID=UPI001E38EEE0|nr:amino acid permease [Actinocorallia sp. API 0066]MCD0453715.1 amino acid permease [Actinocorallia sp. API 0066]